MIWLTLIPIVVYWIIGCCFISVWDVREATRRGDVDGPGYTITQLYKLAIGWPWYYKFLGGIR